MNSASAAFRSLGILACSLALSACGGDAPADATKPDAAPQAQSPATGDVPPSTPGTDAATPPPDPALAGRVDAAPPAPVSEKAEDHPGFEVEVLKEGEGEEVAAGNTVKVRYIGTLLNGKEFDSSWKRGTEPIEFSLSGVVPGFRMGLLGMKVGGHRRITVPGVLGYGAAGSPGAGIGANETLVFDVELVDVVN